MAAEAADLGLGAAVPVELRRERRMVCVEYPGVVRDVAKMLPTLGGEEGVSRIYADPTKRLELYFRPKDPYCHPVCANRFSTSSLLLRIRKRTRRQKGVLGTEAHSEVTFDMEILGIISTIYKFQGMSDFQYLAVHTEAGGKHTSMYDKVLMLRPEKEAFFHQELPLYIPPPIFSRLDAPVDYFYRPETQHREGYNNPPISGENLIGLSRARRPHNAIFVNFEDEEVPKQPLEAAAQTWRRVCTNPVDRKVEEELRKLFDIRPIWSRNAVKANISVHPDKLKVLLPFIAYYMITGPWRSLWIRFGYDPRKNPDAKIYQVLDFRIRCGMKHGYAPSDLPVKAKRSTYNYSLPITVKKTSSQLVTMHDLKQGLGPSGTSGARKPASSKYKLKVSLQTLRVRTRVQSPRAVCVGDIWRRGGDKSQGSLAPAAACGCPSRALWEPGPPLSHVTTPGMIGIGHTQEDRARAGHVGCSCGRSLTGSRFRQCGCPAGVGGFQSCSHIQAPASRSTALGEAEKGASRTVESPAEGVGGRDECSRDG
ncbi:general transcription factor 3C polypeptide 5 isoform X1 [Homo sapiens]|uniref:general transcription factor 3C polypeptide 5 isoform X1 n=1 Tax=Homo sapiens TaxID=9606 RepID=UPI000387D607|nr:general transcription factor 3C polypeptide 5 isoform X1 [Homo sapiens]XP_054220149.1 general transcription factor 3C polypeptide 5 isoform X1 [Homo sapiens]